MKYFLLFLFICCVGTTGSWAAPRQSADLIIRNISVVDVEHGRIIANRTVVSRGGDIMAVGGDRQIVSKWNAAQIIDGRGKFLVPGLWDMHVHFGGGPDLIEENKALMPLYVAHGVTTLRDCAGDLAEQVLAWRADISAGRMFGPTLLTSGPKLEGLKPLWKGTIEVGSEVDVDAALARLKLLDADFVKITDSTLKPELFLYAVKQAKAMGLRTSGHIPMALTVEQAVDAGLSSIEHLDYVYDAGVRDDTAIAADFAAGRIDRETANLRQEAGFDPIKAQWVYRDFAAKGVAVTPTLNGSRIIAWLDSEKHQDDAYLAYIGPKLRQTYEWRVERAAKADANAIARRHAQFDRIAATLPMLQKAGIPIMAGTDAGFLNSFNYPGIGLHDELSLFVKLGLTPAEALKSATWTGPAWFGKLDRYGSVAAGKASELVIVNADPLSDISVLRTPHAVIMRGKYFERGALDAMLTETAAMVRKWNSEMAAAP